MRGALTRQDVDMGQAPYPRKAPDRALARFFDGGGGLGRVWRLKPATGRFGRFAAFVGAPLVLSGQAGGPSTHESAPAPPDSPIFY